MKLPSEVLNRIDKRIYYDVDTDVIECDSRCGFYLSNYGLLLKNYESAEVIRTNEICQIPGTPGWFLGIANQRGILFPVFDLCKFFGISDEQINDWILFFGEGSKAVGIKINQLPVIVKINKKKDQVKYKDETPDFLLPYITDAYKYNNTVWYDISFNGLFMSLQESFE